MTDEQKVKMLSILMSLEWKEEYFNNQCFETHYKGRLILLHESSLMVSGKYVSELFSNEDLESLYSIVKEKVTRAKEMTTREELEEKEIMLMELFKL